MKSDPVLLDVLFRIPQRFDVPLFQRAYSWEEENWGDLWGDVERIARDILRAENGEQVLQGKHFLGAIVLGFVPHSGTEMYRKIIVDGQQRLTTLQILLKALLNFLRREGIQDMQMELENMTENRGTWVQGDQKYKVWPSNRDRPAFELVMGQEDIPRDRKEERKIVLCYQYFCDRLERFVQDDGEEDESHESSERAKALFRALTRHAELMQIDLEEGDDAQIIFESLNFRGKALSNADLIRNFVFIGIDSKRQESVFNEYWAGFNSKFWLEQEGTGQNKKTRIDSFILYYMQYKNRRNYDFRNLYREFQNWWGDQKKTDGWTVEGELAEFQRWGQDFQDLVEGRQGNCLKGFTERIKALKHSTVYPVLLTLIEKNKVTDEDLESIVIDLESFLVRRYICGRSASYTDFFISIIKRFEKKERIIPDEFREVFGKTGIRAWPDDEEFCQAWLGYRAYGSTRNLACRMILTAIEERLQTSPEVAVKRDLTIEHVMPRKWEPYWPLHEGSDGQRRDEIVHTFGNLTLLRSDLNLEISNGCFERKQPEITRKSVLTINQYFQSLVDQPWNEEAIEKRGRELFEIAKKIWPHPGR